MLLTGQRRYPCDRKGHSSVRVEGEFLCVCPFSTVSPPCSSVFVLFQPALHNVLLCLSLFGRVSTNFFCVCPFSTDSLQSSWCSGEDVRGGPEGVRAGDPGGLGQLNHLNWALGAWCSSAKRVVHLLVEHLVHLGALCASHCGAPCLNAGPPCTCSNPVLPSQLFVTDTQLLFILRQIYRL